MINFEDESVQRTLDRLKIEELPESYNLVDHIQNSKIPFSKRAFGPGTRTEGISDHIRKELLEIAEDPLDVEEWIDVANLALDGAWRCLHGRIPEDQIAPLIAAVIQGKQEKNEAREWPDWRDCDPNKAITHTSE